MIRALVFNDNRLQVVDKACPKPKEDEVLVRIKLAGICNTDLEITEGYLNFNGVLGHEFVGEVAEDPHGKLEGERVVGSINIPCGECYLCQDGVENHCLNMEAIGMRGRDGAFAEYMVLPRSNVYLVPEGISDREAVFVEPLAAGMEILEQLHIKPSDEVVILGDGKLGLSIARVLKVAGKKVSLVGKHREKLDTLNKLEVNTYLLGEYKGPSDVVVECTGSSSGLSTALELVKPRGTIVLKTTTADLQDIDMSTVAVDEINIVGSRCGPFAPTLRLLQSNELHLEEMIDAVYPLEEGIDAMKKAQEKGVLKVLMKI